MRRPGCAVFTFTVASLLVLFTTREVSTIPPPPYPQPPSHTSRPHPGGQSPKYRKYYPPSSAPVPDSHLDEIFNSQLPRYNKPPKYQHSKPNIIVQDPKNPSNDPGSPASSEFCAVDVTAFESSETCCLNPDAPTDGQYIFYESGCPKTLESVCDILANPDLPYVQSSTTLLPVAEDIAMDSTIVTSSVNADLGAVTYTDLCFILFSNIEAGDSFDASSCVNSMIGDPSTAVLSEFFANRMIVAAGDIAMTMPFDLPGSVALNTPTFVGGNLSVIRYDAAVNIAGGVIPVTGGGPFDGVTLMIIGQLQQLPQDPPDWQGNTAFTVFMSDIARDGGNIMPTPDPGNQLSMEQQIFFTQLVQARLCSAAHQILALPLTGTIDLVGTELEVDCPMGSLLNGFCIVEIDGALMEQALTISITVLPTTTLIIRVTGDNVVLQSTNIMGLSTPVLLFFSSADTVIFRNPDAELTNPLFRALPFFAPFAHTVELFTTNTVTLDAAALAPIWMGNRNGLLRSQGRGIFTLSLLQYANNVLPNAGRSTTLNSCDCLCSSDALTPVTKQARCIVRS